MAEGVLLLLQWRRTGLSAVHRVHSLSLSRFTASGLVLTRAYTLYVIMEVDICSVLIRFACSLHIGAGLYTWQSWRHC